MAGLYIHVPFCASRCVYCGFFSTTALARRHEYTLSVCREMEIRRGYLGNEEIKTIYIGGGTPSQLTVSDLSLLVDTSRLLAPNALELTIECNPDDVNADLAHSLKTIGVNRVSMGIQTFNDHRLSMLHRRHTAKQAIDAVAILRDSGFENISVDLMSGFPGQTLGEWESDLYQAISLSVPHISSYSLMYEEDTPLYRDLQAGIIQELEEDTCIKMYDMMCERLEAEGYEHYEISNFGKPGFHSLHNSSYWDGTPYLGVGAGAHSYDRKSRQWNVTDLDLYISAIASGQIPFEIEHLDGPTQVNDMITTALRTCNGLDLAKVAACQGEDIASQVLSNAQPHLDSGLLRLDGRRLILTRKGIHLSDLIMSDLIILST